jgi:hypothetical protein
MTALMRVLGVVGLADAVWMLATPERWSTFWQGFLGKAARRPWGMRLLSAAELGFSAALLAGRWSPAARPHPPAFRRGKHLLWAR